MKRSKSMVTTAVFVVALFCGAVFFSGQALALEASTTMTVLNVIKWNSSDASSYRTQDHIIHSSHFHSDGVIWEWDPAWPAYPNSVSAAIWFIWSVDQSGRISHDGKYWEALGWDWVGNHTTTKHAEMWRLSDNVGLMFTTVCGPTSNCSTHPSKERSNVMMAPNPYAFK